MKVLCVDHLLDPVTGGGTAERTFQVSRFLAKEGAECSILTTDIGLSPERMDGLRGITVMALPYLNRRFFVPRFSYRKVRDLIASADIVHMMGHWTFLNALAYFIVRRLGKPYVVCPAGALPIYGRSKFIKALYNSVAGTKIIRNANGHIAITADEIPQFEAYGVDRNQVVVVPNGVDSADFPPSEAAGFREKHKLGSDRFILFVGRLNPIKGPDLLLDAFAQAYDSLDNLHLVFAGPDGGMLSGLRDKAAAFDLDNRVHFVGYLGGSEKAAAYQSAELLVIPSRQEAMSIVVLEAGISATPVLLTDKCGFDEVAPVKGGKIVTATVEGLHDGLMDLLKDNSDLKTMGANLKEHVIQHFTWTIAAARILNIFQMITQKAVVPTNKRAGW